MDLEAELVHLKGRVQSLEAIVASQSASIAVAQQAAHVQAAEVPARQGPAFLPPGMADQPPPPVGPPNLGGYPAPAPAQPAARGVAVTARNYPAATKEPIDFGVESMLRWAGVGLVTLAGIFLVSTAVSRGWIGPELQLFFAALGGAALLGASTYFAERRRPWSLALGCAGAIVLIVSALATHGWLDLFGPGPALVLTAAATAVSVGVAWQTKHETVAVVAFLVALIGALETAEDVGSVATLCWVMAVILASTGLGLVKQWSAVRLVTGWTGAAILASYSLAEIVEGATRVVALIGAISIALTLAGGSILATRSSRVSAIGPEPAPGQSPQFRWSTVDYRIVGLVPGWFWVVVAPMFDITEATNGGVDAIVIALVFGLAALLLRQFDKLISTSTLMGALTLMAVGLALTLGGYPLMIALAGQAIGSYLIARALDDKMLRIGGYVAMGVASLLALRAMFEALERSGFRSAGGAVSTGLIVALWVAAAVVTFVRSDELELPFEPLFVTAWVGVMAWIAATLIGVPQGLGLISAVWAVMACVGLVAGLQHGLSLVRTTAMLTLGVTLFKLVTVDMASVDVFWRVGLFFVVGMGLIVLGLKVPSLIAATEANNAPNTTDPVPTTTRPTSGPRTF